jgi:hypothetical protein
VNLDPPSPETDDDDNEPLPEPVMRPITLEDLNETFPEPSLIAPIFPSDVESSTPQERQETYSFISNALGLMATTSGDVTSFQEAKGSYQAYKQGLTRIYYGKILEAHDDSSSRSSSSQKSSASSGTSPKPAEDSHQVTAIPPTATQRPKRIESSELITERHFVPVAYPVHPGFIQNPAFVAAGCGMAAPWLPTNGYAIPAGSFEAPHMLFDPRLALASDVDAFSPGSHMPRWYPGYGSELQMLPAFDAPPSDPQFYLEPDLYYSANCPIDQCRPELEFQAHRLGDMPVHMPMIIGPDGRPVECYPIPGQMEHPAFPPGGPGPHNLPHFAPVPPFYSPFPDEHIYRIHGYERRWNSPLSTELVRAHEMGVEQHEFDAPTTATNFNLPSMQ